MIDPASLAIILSAGLVASASPGPATLSIAATSMQQGRAKGLAFASGVMTGSLTWSFGAALGLGTLMMANAWVFEILRYFGAAYLLFLAWKSARSALASRDKAGKVMPPMSLRKAWSKGLALHLTNPKAILFFGSLYAIGLPANATWGTLGVVIAALGIQSASVFHGYAILFSSPRIAAGYMRLRGWFEAGFALAFGAAGIKVLTTRLGG